MLQLLHVLLGLLHVAFLLHHELGFELRLLPHRPVQVLLVRETVIACIVLESPVPLIANRVI